MNKNLVRLFVALALSLPSIAWSQPAKLSGDLNATMSAGQSKTFVVTITAASQGFQGQLDLHFSGSSGLTLGQSVVQPNVLNCPEVTRDGKTFIDCGGSVTLGPNQTITVTQTVVVRQDVYDPNQTLHAQLVGDFLSGAPTLDGVITVNAPGPRIMVIKIDVLGFGGAPPNITLQNFGSSPGTWSLTINPDPARGPYLVVAGSQPSSGTLSPGAFTTLGFTPAGNVSGAYNGSLTVAGDVQGGRIDIPFPQLFPGPTTSAANPHPVSPQSAVVVPTGCSPCTNPEFDFDIHNDGPGDAIGEFSADKIWIILPPGLVTVPAGETKTFTGSVDLTQLPNPLDSGSTTGTLTFAYGRPSTPKTAHPLDSGTISTISITVVAVVPPQTGNSAIPPLAKRCQNFGCWQETALFVPGIGHVVGSVGQFISDVTLFPRSGTRSLSGVDMYFTPLGAASSTASKVTVNGLAPPSSAGFVDMVSTVYKVQQIGSLQIRAPGFEPDTVIALNANVFNVSNKAGTYGTSLPMFASYTAVKGTDKEYLTGLRKDATSHTNIYLQEAQGSDITASIDFYDANGTKLGSTSKPVPAFSAIQFGGGEVPTGTVSAAVGVASGGGAVHAFATPVDEASGDTWVVPDWSRIYSYYDPILTNGSNVLIPVAGAAHGANNTFFKTDASIMNIGSTPSSGTLAYVIRGAQTIQKTISLSALQTQTLTDITTNFFGVTTDSVGYITYTPTSGHVAITSRNYTVTTGSPATFGTGLPTLPLRTTFGGGGSFGGAGISNGATLRLAGIEDAAPGTINAAQPGSFRSNFGFVEVGGQSATVQVTIYFNTSTDKTSVVQGASSTFTVAANEFRLVGDLASSVLGAARTNLGDLHAITVEFKVTAGSGRVVPFVSSVDNGTGDSTFASQ